MSFDPRAEGFAWPDEVDVSNAAGASMRIRPYLVRSAGIADAQNEREKECYRFYQTPIGLLTELEVKYWQIGGINAVGDFLTQFNAIFALSNAPRPASVVVTALLQGGLSPIVIEVNLGWLIKGNYITFDPERMLIGKK